jgi:FdhD protein
MSLASKATTKKDEHGFSILNTRQWRDNQWQNIADKVVDEVPVALVYNGISHAVMMATPCDLTDFAIGFSLTEEIIDNTDQIYDLQIERHTQGYEISLSISAEKMQRLKQVKRNIAGNTGCGLCGIDSLDAMNRKGKTVTAAPLPDAKAIAFAVHSLDSWQTIQQQTGACHAAAWCNLDGEKILIREDVGRHNAFDKLIGAMAKEKIKSTEGFALISSRASYEMVHKASFLQCANLVAVSAPTSMAIEQAVQLNINLIGFARNDKFNVYHCASTN